MLDALRPKTETNFHEIAKIAAAGGYRAVLPSALEDQLLLSLARDIRMVERWNNGHADADPPIVAPLCVISEILGRHMEVSKLDETVELSGAAMVRAFSTLQIAIEREIVGRIVGVNSEERDKFLLERIDSLGRACAS